LNFHQLEQNSVSFFESTGQKSKKKLGKKFESELGVACKPITRYHHNSNSLLPQCDRTAVMKLLVLGPDGFPFGPTVGQSFLFEAKETISSSFYFGDVSPAERSNLNNHFQEAGVSAVCIKMVSNKPRAFAILWKDWVELESGHGFDPLHDAALLGRRKAGTASFSLLDGERPFTMLELFKVKRPDIDGNNLGSTWDLLPLIPEGMVRA
jgi:hypothetical protein